MKSTFLVLLCFLASCKLPLKESSQIKVLLEENTSHLQDKNLAPFYHGVASGDPLQKSVILWTRVTPKYKSNNIPVQWEIALDSKFRKVVGKGNYKTNVARDYTVKVEATNLRPNTKYFYRFKALDSYSKVGETKTIAQGDEEINLAVVSCSNIEFGYFNAYAAICKEEVDAVIHLGDYIYEYGPDVYGDKEFYRKNIPPHEIISLQDYRDRYSQYRLDEDLKKLHTLVPFINIWDDHEITNNAYVEGAQNHQADEGDYLTRKNIARQVFYEWLPIRETKTHYRSFNFGDNLDLIMLDERLAGRTIQPDTITDSQRVKASHTLLGKTQMQWLEKEMKNSSAQWKIIGNQVIFSYSDWGYDGFRQNMDAWDGYPADQKKLSDIISNGPIQNVIFVTGDTHTGWAFEATAEPFSNYNPQTAEGAIGIEFGVTSISSGNSNERMSNEKVLKHEKKIKSLALNPHLKYVNMRDHGYLKLSINKSEVTAEFKIVEDLSQRSTNSSIDQTFIVRSGQNKLVSQ